MPTSPKNSISYPPSPISESKNYSANSRPQFNLEKWLLFIRIWSGVGLIFLLTIQIITGYILVAKLPEFLDYRLVLFIHTQMSWILIYFFLTHTTVNLRNLFRRWWPSSWKALVPPLVSVYAVATLLTLYIQFFKQ